MGAVTTMPFANLHTEEEMAWATTMFKLLRMAEETSTEA
jgi:hypothetical protein